MGSQERHASPRRYVRNVKLGKVTRADAGARYERGGDEARKVTRADAGARYERGGDEARKVTRADAGARYERGGDEARKVWRGWASPNRARVRNRTAARP